MYLYCMMEKLPSCYFVMSNDINSIEDELCALIELRVMTLRLAINPAAS